MNLDEIIFYGSEIFISRKTRKGKNERDRKENFIIDLQSDECLTLKSLH